MSGQEKSPMQIQYDKLLKIAETELCKICDKEPITDIWHSMCNQCAIYAEQAAFEAQFEGPNDPDLEE